MELETKLPIEQPIIVQEHRKPLKVIVNAIVNSIVMGVMMVLIRVGLAIWVVVVVVVDLKVSVEVAGTGGAAAAAAAGYRLANLSVCVSLRLEAWRLYSHIPVWRILCFPEFGFWASWPLKWSVTYLLL
jgi:hypothetical protein